MGGESLSISGESRAESRKMRGITQVGYALDQVRSSATDLGGEGV
jgi:hypothetical protein